MKNVKQFFTRGCDARKFCEEKKIANVFLIQIYVIKVFEITLVHILIRNFFKLDF